MSRPSDLTKKLAAVLVSVLIAVASWGAKSVMDETDKKAEAAHALAAKAIEKGAKHGEDIAGIIAKNYSQDEQLEAIKKALEKQDKKLDKVIDLLLKERREK